MENLTTPSAHTPGGWNVASTGEYGVQKLITAEDGSLLAIVGAFPDSDPGEVEANARLMAASPAMYERLRAMREYLESFFEEYAKLDYATKMRIAESTCPIARLEDSIAEIDALLADVYPERHA